MNVPEHILFLNVGNKLHKGEGVMNKRHVFYVGLVLLAVLALFGAPMAAMAAHPAVTTLKADGSLTTATDAYSPKQTCGGCHFDCATGLNTTVTASFCQDNAARTAWFAGGSCNTPGKCRDYQSLEVSTVTKIQGYKTAGGTYADMTYDVAIPLHGASVGHHSTEGRNESLVANQRTIWAAPATISSPGMWGRF